jgi:cob(I)alamin adenosyltransferase
MSGDRPPMRRPDGGYRRAPSVLIVNTGEGKGKTTAAMGVVLRAVARGWRVCVVQFVKSGRWRTGEEDVAGRLGVDWRTLGEGFTWDSEDLKRDRAMAQRAWEEAAERIASGAFDLVVLDEITYPINWGWIDGGEVAEALRDRPGNVNVVATGRDAPEVLVAMADTVTEMVKVRHAYDRGIGARRGIDF